MKKQIYANQHIIEFPQKTEEQKQLHLLSKQFEEIEAQGLEIECQTRRVKEFARKNMSNNKVETRSDVTSDGETTV
jgi:hypothetical protein